MNTVLHSVYIALALAAGTLGVPVLSDAQASNTTAITKVLRADTTCADPTLASTIYQAFYAPQTRHSLHVHGAYVAANTINGNAGFTDIQPDFVAWTSQQPSTTPLWQWANSARTDYLYIAGGDVTNPPIVNGYPNDRDLVAWVYTSQICGSVPLYSVIFGASTDRYWTIDTKERDWLISAGWRDDGILAYVLPLIHQNIQTPAGGLN